MLEAAAEAIVAESVVERDVGLVGRLPLERGIRVVDRNESDYGRLTKDVPRSRISRESDQRCVGRNAGISQSAPASAKPQLRARTLRNEARLTEAPRSRNGWKDSP